MFSQIIRTLGWIGFAVGIGYFILADETAREQGNPVYIHYTQEIFLASAVLVVGGYALKYLSGVAGVGKSRCRKCGKRVATNEMFCFDHKKEA
ncbi:MAG TPA: hypothetical protein VLR94_11215, partial [Acidobacteriota bacterium]|nr:hypothetical protein [Acidobacteriota bacterium]